MTTKTPRERSEWTDSKDDPRMKRNINLNLRHVRFLKSRPQGGSAWIRDTIDAKLKKK